MTDLLYYQDAYLAECEACVVHVDEDGIALDRTVFYAVGGGQPGDSGVLRLEHGTQIVIENTRRKSAGGRVLHIPSTGHSSVKLKVADRVHATLDWEKRDAHMRIHPCLHLLSAVIPAGVTGGAIRPDSGRLDFELPAVALDRDGVEAKLNALISADHAVNPSWITGTELDARPELVKTMSVAHRVASPAYVCSISRALICRRAGVPMLPARGKSDRSKSRKLKARVRAIVVSQLHLRGHNVYAV